MSEDNLFYAVEEKPKQRATTSKFVPYQSKAAGFPYEVTRDYGTQLEPVFYPEYKNQYLQNPLATLLVDYVVDALAGNYEIVPGPQGGDGDVEKVKEFFYLHGTRSQLRELTLQAVLLGNGFGQLEKKGDSIREFDEKKPYEPAFKRVDAESITIKRDEKGKEEFVQIIGGTEKKLKREDLLVMRLKRYPTTPYGISFLRSSLHTLKALSELIRDVPAAIKNFAYIHRLAKLDLEGFDTVEEMDEAINDFQNHFNKIDPATSGVIVVDKNHDIGYMANVGGQGGSQNRIIPIMDLIEPLLSFVMLNFMMALGHIEQTGANKAIIEAQEARVKEQLESMRAEWARVIDLELLQYIVGGPLKVQLKHRPSQIELLQDREIMVQERLAGLISREKWNERTGFNDEGTDVLDPMGGGIGDTGGNINDE